MKAIVCVVRRARAAPVISRGGMRAINASIDEMAAIILIFSCCPVFPMAVRVVVSKRVNAVMIAVIDSMVRGIAPFV